MTSRPGNSLIVIILLRIVIIFLNLLVWVSIVILVSLLLMLFLNILGDDAAGILLLNLTVLKYLVGGSNRVWIGRVCS